ARKLDVAAHVAALERELPVVAAALEPSPQRDAAPREQRIGRVVVDRDEGPALERLAAEEAEVDQSVGLQPQPGFGNAHVHQVDGTRRRSENGGVPARSVVFPDGSARVRLRSGRWLIEELCGPRSTYEQIGTSWESAR